MEKSHLGLPGESQPAQGGPAANSPLSQSLQQTNGVNLDEEFDPNQRDTIYSEGESHGSNIRRTASTISQSNTLLPSRGGTLKKKQSLKKSGSIKRSSSRKSLGAGSVKSLVLGDKEKYADQNEMNSAFYTPVPTTGNPTEILSNRFQAWRKVLKDLIAYFRDVQKSYETRSKSLLSISNVINNTNFPPAFMTEGGISDATHILRDYYKQSLSEGNKAKSIEEDVIIQLTGLRSDLQQKVKEIKNLSGDFKNSVDKETEGTRKAVRNLQEALGMVDTDPGAASGKGDPFIVKLGVERQVERQIDEENYLHRAFLNLENSGRELESIVVGEIQKAYNAYAGILKREADEVHGTVERLRNGPIVMPKDREWDAFVSSNEHFINPNLPLRSAEHIHYPGRDDPAAAEVRSGLLERKSKYLKSYTPGWYVLSPTHLHEFKSPDHINSQNPIMSLYLPEQKLGSHSGADSSSHKFMLKGRQTGGIHRGHGWVFRAESYETMLAWFGDIKTLTEKTGEERNAFVRRHARSLSGTSQKAPSISSDGALEEDEADEVPYSATASHFDGASTMESKNVDRPQPGGRFPSDVNIERNLRVPLSPSSGSSDERDMIGAAGAIPGTSVPYEQRSQQHEDQNIVRENSTALGVVPQEHDFAASGINQERQAQVTPQAHVPDRSNQQFSSSQTFQQLQHSAEVASGLHPLPVNQDPRSPLHEQPPVPILSAHNTQPSYFQGISSDGPGTVSYGVHQTQDGADLTTPRGIASASGPETQHDPNTSYAQGVSSDQPGVVSYVAPQTQQRSLQEKLAQPAPQVLPRQRSSQATVRHDSMYGDWMAPVAAGAAGAAVQAHNQDSEAKSAERRPVENLTATRSGTVLTSGAIPPQGPELSHIGNAALSPHINHTVDPPKSDAASVRSDISLASTVQDEARPFGQPTRPLVVSYQSSQTISDLHVPGEYPKQ